MPWSDWSLRRKLIVAGGLVQIAAAVLLVYASTRLLQRALIDQARIETQRVLFLLDQTIAVPLAQRDYATLQQTLDLVRSDQAINYLVLRDHRDRVVATSGWDEAVPLPPRDAGDIDLERPDSTIHLAAPVTVAGQALGRFELGLSTIRLRQARADFLRGSVGIGAAALLASMLVLAAIAFAITRHLARLAHASGRVAGGDLDVQVPETTNDEIGRLGASFNAMALALKARVSALECSEAEQKRLLEVARDEQARLSTLLGAMQSGILFFDEGARLIYANAAFARLWSLPELEEGVHLAEIVPELLRQVDAADAQYIELMLQASGDQESSRRELHTLDGRIVVQRRQPVLSGAQGGGSIWIYDDVTLERSMQQRAQQALHDPLTALVNRRGLDEALQAATAGAASRGDPVSLLFIDLDDFKRANDVGGHRIGDAILVAVARALTSQMRKGEIVARLGGDEFAILCPSMDSSAAVALAARLVDAVASLRFPTPEQVLRVGCSIGTATYPIDAQSGADLIACADAAMYEAKRSGKNRCAPFRAVARRPQRNSDQGSWQTRIQRAIEHGRFVLHFQPVHRAADLRLTHHEAMVRMIDEDDAGRLIPPPEFIPHAERNGSIRQIDRWVINACADRLASAAPSVCIAANLSARSFEDPSFAGFLLGALQGRDVDPRRLCIELNEAHTLNDLSLAQQQIRALRGVGCAVHLDDFGGGFNAFAALKLLDAEAIKIDGALIRSLQGDSSSRLFVTSMIDMAHNLQKIAIAEHVEDANTLDTLRSLGVDLVQGFHLGRPSVVLCEVRSGTHLNVVPNHRRGARGEAV